MAEIKLLLDGRDKLNITREQHSLITSWTAEIYFIYFLDFRGLTLIYAWIAEI